MTIFGTCFEMKGSSSLFGVSLGLLAQRPFEGKDVLSFTLRALQKYKPPLFVLFPKETIEICLFRIKIVKYERNNDHTRMRKL